MAVKQVSSRRRFGIMPDKTAQLDLMMRFKNKSVMVTGAGSGIGRATAIEFAREGARVAVVDLNPAGGEETVERIKVEGGEAWFVQTDVSDEASVTALFASIEQRFGVLDVAVNNAGIQFGNYWFEDTTLEHFDRIMAVNVRGVFLCMQAEIRLMKQQHHGSIVNTTSLAAHESQPMLSAYTASKHAVWGLTKTAAIECARAGIQINAISPGAVETEMFEAYFSGRPDERRALLDVLPTGRAVTPREIGRGILFLASADAAQFLGQALNMDGGCVEVKP